MRAAFTAVALAAACRRGAAVALAFAVALIPAAAAAHMVGVYRTYLEDPAAARAELQAEIDALEREVAAAESRAAEAREAYRSHHERAVRIVRFHEALSFGLTLHALFGSADLVELLSRLRALARAAERDLAVLRELQQLQGDALAASAELEARRAALEDRLRLLEWFTEAARARQAFQAEHPDPAQAAAALTQAWQEQAPLALALLDHLRNALRDGGALFADQGAEHVLTSDALLQRVLPLPGGVDDGRTQLDVFILSDHVYWAVRRPDGPSILITFFEPHDRRQLRLTVEQVLYRGLPLPEDALTLLNTLYPILVDVSPLDVDPRTVRQEDGRIVLGGSTR